MTAPLAIQGLHHLAVITTDTQRSAAFYEDVLGFARIPRPAFNFGGAWLYREDIGLQMHIIEHPAATQAEGPIDTKTNHVALIVPDLDAAESQLKKRGINYVRQVNAGGYQQIFFRDPDGHHVEVGVYPETVTQ